MGYSFFVGVHKAECDANPPEEPRVGPSVFAGTTGVNAEFANGDYVDMLQRREQEMRMALLRPKMFDSETANR